MKAEDVLQEKSHREEYYSLLHEEQKVDDEYYELTFDAGIPMSKDNKTPLYAQRTPPTARSWVDIGVRHFTLDNPQASVLARGKGESPREKDAHVEAFLNFWLARMILQIKMAAKKSLLRGEVFLKIGMDDTYFGSPSSPDKLQHFPLLTSVPDPINVYCSPAHDGLVPADVIESFKITVAEAERLCDRNKWSKAWLGGQKSTDKVTWTSFISATERFFFIEEVPLLKGDAQHNILGFCPYIHIPSGFGNSDYDGSPEKLYRSIIFPNRGMLKLEARALSQADAYNARYAWRNLVIVGEEVDVQRLYPDGKPTLNPNEVLRAVEGTSPVRPEFLRLDSMPTGLMDMLLAVRSQAQPPSVLSGVRPTGVYSAQGMEDLMSTAKPMYKDTIKNLEEGLAIFLGMGLRIIDKVYKDKVGFKDLSEGSARQKEIEPDDIKGHYDCEVNLLAEPPEATDMRKTLGTNLQKAGVISHKYNLMHYQNMTEEEAEDVMAQMVAEWAMKQPGLLEGVVRDAMVRMGMGQQLEEMQRKLAEEIPPRRTPETMGTARESVPIRGRQSTIAGGASPHEFETGAIPFGA